MSKLNLLMLNYEFPPIGGGAGKAHLCLLEQFAGNSSLNIDVLTSAPKPGFTKEEYSENITIYKVGVHKKNLHFWRRIEVLEWLFKAKRPYRKLLRENKYDLGHAFFGFPTGWLSYRTAKKLPYIISLRGSDVPGYNIRLGLEYKLLSGLFRRIWNSATVVVANSKGLQSLASQFTPNLDIKIITNGINAEIFHPSKEKNLTKPMQLLTVCRLINRKRLDLLIRAVDKARQLGLNIQLNIAGDGNLMGQLKNLTTKLNIAESVNFLLRVPAEKMPQLYRDNDVFVMCSAHEGMSNAMLEAMASGLPIITTHCEGVDELIGDNGIVIEKAEVSEIATAIKKLADDQETYTKMSVAARTHAEKFTWGRVAEKYLALYERLK